MRIVLLLAGFVLVMMAGGGAQAMTGNGTLGKTGLKKHGAHSFSLVMFEQQGCHYCEVWDRQIGVSYGKTPEGRFAPLTKKDIHYDDLGKIKPVVFTPTFVLMKDGKELGRLTGFISEDFFWGLLKPMLEKQGYREKIKESRVTTPVTKAPSK